MRIELSYTLADLDEGLIPEAFARDPRRYRRRITLAVVPWILVFVMFGSFIRALSLGLGTRLAVPHDVVSEMVPNAAAAGFLCVAAVLFMWSGWKKARARAPAREGPAKKLTSGQRVLV